MGFFKKLKSVTGLGLSSDETYMRAFEKGVLVKDYSNAASLFSKAAEKFQKDNNQEGYIRAMANQFLYSYIIGKGNQSVHDQIQLIEKTISFLEQIDEIERVGSQTETVPTNLIIYELQGRKHEILAENTTSPEEKVTHHTKAAEFFGELGENILLIGGESSRPLHYFHLGSSQFHVGMIKSEFDPGQAAEILQEAYNNFRLAQAEKEASNTLIHIRKLSAITKCWICGKIIQGQDLHFQYYEANVTPYYRNIIENEPEEQRPEFSEEGLPLCTTCGSMLCILADGFAKLRANEVRKEIVAWVNSLVNEINTVLKNHSDRIRDLERYKHSH